MSLVASARLPGLIGHELRNPLASAMTGVVLAREMVDGDDPRAPVLDGALRDLERLRQLLDGWLRLARTDSTKAVTIAVDDLVVRTAERNGVEVCSRCAEARVTGDPCLLERALENLFENARQAGARRIRVAVQALQDEVSIHVEDDGAGVPSKDAERIFAPGWSGRGGTGLGLHAVATTVAAHMGRVRCVPLARGTRFSITLPMAIGCATHA